VGRVVFGFDGFVWFMVELGLLFGIVLIFWMVENRMGNVLIGVAIVVSESWWFVLLL